MQHNATPRRTTTVASPSARLCGLVIALVLSAGAPAVFGQQANGNGQGLQRNLHRFNQSQPARDPLGSARFQNSVLYGNATNGKSFQGNLGYSNPFEFQGRLGSNDLYKFSRDSAFSGAAGRGIGGAQLNDYQGALARGERGLSAGLGGVFDLQRQGTNYGSSGGGLIAPRSGGLRQDPFNSAAGRSLSSSSAASSGRGSGDFTSPSTSDSLLTSNLASRGGQPRQSRGSAGSHYGTSTGSADDLLNESLSMSHSNVLDRSLTNNDRAAGLSGAASESARERGSFYSSRPNQAPSNKVNNRSAAAGAVDLAVPKLKTSYDELKERLDKLDSKPGQSPVTLPSDKLPEGLPAGNPPGTQPGSPEANPDGSSQGSPNSSAGGSVPGSVPGSAGGSTVGSSAGRTAPLTWQGRIDELRGKLAGENGRSEKVTLLGQTARTRGFVNRPSKLADRGATLDRPGPSSDPSSPGDAASDKDKGRPKGTARESAVESAGSGVIPDGKAPGHGATVTPRTEIVTSANTQVPERFRDPSVKPGDASIPRAHIDPKTLQLIRDAGGRVDSLRPTGDDRDFFSEHMRSGEEQLGKAMYFDAEERFARAIDVKPGDVTGHVGRIHAQLGAGLFLSAGHNLRRVLAAHPEATAQRYSEALMPSKDRIEQLVYRLRENQRMDGPIRRESALALAYLGFQTSSRPMAGEGIEAMTKAIGQDPEAKPGEDERLIELLKAVWLDESFYAPATPASEQPDGPAESKPAATIPAGK